MSVLYEKRACEGGTDVWIGKYRNLHNLPHWHMEHEMIACPKGRALLTVDGTSYWIGEGTAAFCAGGSVHYIDGEDDSVTIVAQISRDLLKPIVKNGYPKSPVFVDQYHTWQRLTEISGQIKAQDSCFVEYVHALVIQLVIDIYREVELVPNSTAESVPMMKYRNLLSRIDEQYEFITFREAAASMYMSEAYFSRYFQKITGTTFSQYLNLVRIEKAIRLIQEHPDIPIADVAHRCGFNTIRNFNRVFHKITGYPPRKLPEGFMLSIRAVLKETDSSDPTLQSSVLLETYTDI